MLASLAALFTGGPKSVRERLAACEEVQLLYLFANGNLERAAFVEQATALLGEPHASEIEIIEIFNGACDRATGHLSYTQLRQALSKRPAPPSQPVGSSSPASHTQDELVPATSGDSLGLKRERNNFEKATRCKNF